jgi:glycosyltransferase involved in cell wall biosynthesis
MPAQPKVIAAIPCFNEERFIGEVVRKARKYVDQVIVVDDGSSDATADIAQAAGALVVRHGKREGAGAATKSGFEAAKANDADVLVTLDGDGQHNPDELPQVLAPILNGEADLVIGSRFLGGGNNIPRYRKFGINVITWLLDIGSKVKVSDAQSCYRAYSRKALSTLNITENGFGFSVQLLIDAKEKSLVIQEVPISCLYHSASSSLNPVSHGLGVALTVVKLRSKSLLRRRR